MIHTAESNANRIKLMALVQAMGEVIKQSSEINPAYKLLIRQVMGMVQTKLQELPDNKIDQAIQAFAIIGNGAANETVDAQDIIDELSALFRE